MKFELTRAFIEELKTLISEERKEEAVDRVKELHAADIADVLENLDTKEARYLFYHLEPQIASEILTELEEDQIDSFLDAIPGDIIANELIKDMDSDDATDIIQHLTPKLKYEVLHHLKDNESADDIAKLLVYDEKSAGGLMAKELVRVNYNWDVNTCISEIRRQSEDIDDIMYVYVVDDKNYLKGILHLKQLFTNHGKVEVSSIYDEKSISVQDTTSSEEVASIMEKYDLFVLPVVDSIGRLVGRITIDDVVDVIKEEAEKDYQMVSGISNDIESSDSIFKQSRARLPWLFIGLMGGIFGAQIIGIFDDELHKYVGLTMFLPLIGAMAGNVGVQSSSIIVQSIANKTIQLESSAKKLLRELLGAMFNGFICSVIILLYNLGTSDSFELIITVSTALFSVIIFAAIFGTLVPIVLHKFRIDPALATGPFITTVNDIMGLFIYLTLAKVLFGLL